MVILSALLMGMLYTFAAYGVFRATTDTVEPKPKFLKFKNYNSENNV